MQQEKSFKTTKMTISFTLHIESRLESSSNTSSMIAVCGPYGSIFDESLDSLPLRGSEHVPPVDSHLAWMDLFDHTKNLRPAVVRAQLLDWNARVHCSIEQLVALRLMVFEVEFGPLVVDLLVTFVGAQRSKVVE